MKKLNKMDFYLIIVAVSAFVFTRKMINVFEATGAEPTALVTCVFALLGGECGILGHIKTTQEKKQDREWQVEDRAHEKSKEE